MSEFEFFMGIVALITLVTSIAVRSEELEIAKIKILEESETKSKLALESQDFAKIEFELFLSDHPFVSFYLLILLIFLNALLYIYISKYTSVIRDLPIK